MQKKVHIIVSTKLADVLQTTYSKTHYTDLFTQIRQSFLQEFHRFPPIIELSVDESLSPLTYQLTLPGWASATYELGEWDFVKEQQNELHDIFAFQLRRFIRKWYVNCIDIQVESSLKDQAVVIEYGEDLVDPIESEHFYLQLEEAKERLNLPDIDWSFWESEYVAKDEVVVYIYGKDYYPKRPVSFDTEAETQTHLLEQLLVPILTQNKAILSR